MVEMNCAAYSQAQCKEEKTKISRTIVESLRNSVPPCRFLQKHEIKKADQSVEETWRDIGDKKAWQKTSQLLREMVSKGDHRTVYQKRKWDKQLRRIERREKHARNKQRFKSSLSSPFPFHNQGVMNELTNSYSALSTQDLISTTDKEKRPVDDTRKVSYSSSSDSAVTNRGDSLSVTMYQEERDLMNSDDRNISSAHKTSLNLIHNNSTNHNMNHPASVQMIPMGCNNPVMNNSHISIGNHHPVPHPMSTIAPITPFLGTIPPFNSNLGGFHLGDYHASLPTRQIQFPHHFKTDPYKNSMMNSRFLNLPQNTLVSRMNQAKNFQQKTFL